MDYGYLFFPLLSHAAGEELLGTEIARYLKVDGMRDHDDDFLYSKTVTEYERGACNYIVGYYSNVK